MGFSLSSEDVRWMLTVYLPWVLCILGGTCFIKAWWPWSRLCWTTRSTVCCWELVAGPIQTWAKLNCLLRSGCQSGEMALHQMPPHWSPCLCWEGCFLAMHGGDRLADAYVFLAVLVHLTSWLIIALPVPLQHRSGLCSAGFILWEYSFWVGEQNLRLLQSLKS